MQGPRLAEAPNEVVDDVDCYYMEEAEDLWKMEAELSRAVLVTVTDARPPVDLAAAAAALHVDFGIGPEDMSIHPFQLEDFLVLCRRQSTRDRMVRQGGLSSSSAGFSLSLRPWLRQAQATAASLPYLMPLALVGVPAHAWTRRTADLVLRGLGLVVGVAESTAMRHDMSSYKVWLLTNAPDRVPERHRLFIEEPRRWTNRGWSRAARSSALWYNIRIVRLAPPVLDEEDDPGLPPSPRSPSLPSSPSEDAGEDALVGPGTGTGWVAGRPAGNGERSAPSAAGASSSASAPAGRQGQFQTKGVVDRQHSVDAPDQHSCQLPCHSAVGLALTVQEGLQVPARHVESAFREEEVEPEENRVAHSRAPRIVSSCASGEGDSLAGPASSVMVGCVQVGSPASVTLRTKMWFDGQRDSGIPSPPVFKSWCSHYF